MVFLMAAPAVVGATFPGRDRAQMTFRPRRAAVSRSTPPGLLARSSTRQSGFRSASSASPSTRAGTVFTTRSYPHSKPASCPVCSAP